MRVKSNSFLIAFAAMLVFAVFVSASPPSQWVYPINTATKAEKSTKTDDTVAIGFVEAAAVMPDSTRELFNRKFYGYTIRRNAGKIPIQPLNITAFRRERPDYVPLN